MRAGRQILFGPADLCRAFRFHYGRGRSHFGVWIRGVTWSVPQWERITGCCAEERLRGTGTEARENRQDKRLDYWNNPDESEGDQTGPYLFTRADCLNFQRSCKLLLNSHCQKLSYINVQIDKILLKTKVTKLKTHHFLIILLYFTIIYIFEVISVHLCGRHTIPWWHTTACLFSAPGQHRVGSLKLAMMGMYTPQKLPKHLSLIHI